MGLNERRTAEAIKQKFNGGWMASIQTAAKTQIPIEVEWDTLVKDGQTGYAEEAFEKVFVITLLETFNELCADDMGKSAVASGIKKIVMKNSGEFSNFYNPQAAVLANGVLTLDHSFSNVDQIADRKKDLLEKLSSAL